MKNYYVLDIEWNSSKFGMRGRNGSMLKNEILQIGVVKIEENKITDQLLVNVRPSVLGFVSKKVEELTNLTYHSLKKERTFPNAYKLFCDFIEEFENAVIFTWDTNDLSVLKENCEFWELPMDFDKLTPVDLQACVVNKHFPGEQRKIGVEAAMELFGIVQEGRAHHALVDAQNEGKILLEAFQTLEEACEYYDKKYVLRGNEVLIVEPFIAAFGEQQLKEVLNKERASIYPLRESAKIIYPRFRYKRKFFMVWEEGDELFLEESRISENRLVLTCCVKKIEKDAIESLETKYQRYLKHQEKIMEWLKKKSESDDVLQPPV